MTPTHSPEQAAFLHQAQTHGLRPELEKLGEWFSLMPGAACDWGGEVELTLVGRVLIDGHAFELVRIFADGRLRVASNWNSDKPRMAARLQRLEAEIETLAQKQSERTFDLHSISSPSGWLSLLNALTRAITEERTSH